MIRHHHNPFYHTHLACPVWRSVPTVQRSLPTFTRVVPPSCRPTSTRHRTAAYTACHAMTGRLFSHSMYDVYILTDAVLLAEKSASGVSVSSVWINGVLVPRSVQCVYLYLGMDYRCGNRQPHRYTTLLPTYSTCAKKNTVSKMDVWQYSCNRQYVWFSISPMAAWLPSASLCKSLFQMNHLAVI